MLKIIDSEGKLLYTLDDEDTEPQVVKDEKEEEVEEEIVND